MGSDFPITTGPFKNKKSSIKTPFSGKITTASIDARMTKNSGEKKMRNDFGVKNMKAGPTKGAKKMAFAKGGKMKVPSATAPKAAKSCRKIKSK